MNQRDSRYFNMAIAQACGSECRYHVGCVIVSGNNRVAANNVYKTHPFLLKDKLCYRRTIHAEMLALIRARFDVSGGTAYVARLDKYGNLKMAKPCRICTDLLKEAGIKHVIYSDEGGKVVESEI